MTRTTIEGAFQEWRTTNRASHGSGLAWYLAWHFCKRFYASHGIAPHVINKEGMGYYGLMLEKLRCKVNGDDHASLGRLTITGDVENWRTGGPGDHGLKTAEMCDQGVPAEALVTQAIHHMRLPPLPASSHFGCRHKRWGASYELMFEVMTLLALRHDGRIAILNHPEDIRRILDQLDPQAGMAEHPGGFVIASEGRQAVITGDGQLLSAGGENLWHRYMAGESAATLASRIEHLHNF